MKNLFALLIAGLAASASHAQTFTSISLNNPQNVNGPSFALPVPLVGAVYKYPNAATGIDAYITITSTSNLHSNTSSASDAVGIFAIDNPASINGGYDYAFQPVVSSSNINTSGSNAGKWTKGSCGTGTLAISHSADQNYLAHFRLYFKKAGTNVDTALNLHAAFIDIDGFGGGSEAEQDAFMPGVSYATDPSTSLSFTQRADGLINAEGDPANVTGLQLTQTTAITQVTYLNRTYVDFAFGMNTHNAENRNGCYSSTSGGRLKSVSFATQPGGLTTVVPTKVNLTGKVWDDANGSANGTFTNIGSTGEVGTDGNGLYVYALDPLTNTIIGKATVPTNGFYTITDLPQNQTISLLLTKASLTVGTSNISTTGTLNSGWVNTSPLYRTGVAIGTTNKGDQHFGIERTPTSTTYSASISTPAANSSKILIAASGLAPLAGTDPEDGALGAGKNIVITGLSGLNGNQLYYNSILLTTGDTIKNYNINLLSIKFTNNSATTASFNFNFIDNAGRGGIAAAYTINWPAPPPSNPLPVKLTSFNAHKDGRNAQLTWDLEDQKTLETTYVEHSTNGKNWIQIGQVATHGDVSKYQYTDMNTVSGVNYYRLAFVDNDFSKEYSPIANVTFGSNSEITAYPNPVSNTLNISISGGESITKIVIMNQMGSTVYTGDGSKTQLDVSILTAGYYFVQVINSRGEMTTIKLAKQ